MSQHKAKTGGDKLPIGPPPVPKPTPVHLAMFPTEQALCGVHNGQTTPVKQVVTCKRCLLIINHRNLA